jgi:hypothetical protein
MGVKLPEATNSTKRCFLFLLPLLPLFLLLPPLPPPPVLLDVRMEALSWWAENGKRGFFVAGDETKLMTRQETKSN